MISNYKRNQVKHLVTRNAEERQGITLRSSSAFPANAFSKVVFPEPGGPSSSVILKPEKVFRKPGYLSQDLLDHYYHLRFNAT